MNTDMVLQTGLEVWRENLSGGNGTWDGGDRTCFQPSSVSDGAFRGMKDADAEDVSHLSLCPVCMGKWAKLRQAGFRYRRLGKIRGGPRGVLGHAGSRCDGQARRPLADCGADAANFVLGVLPRMGDPENGMVTLEVVSDAAPEMEGRKATVKDNGGRTILEGTIRSPGSRARSKGCRNWILPGGP